MTRGPKKPIEIETTELCHYGCGKVAKYQVNFIGN